MSADRTAPLPNRRILLVDDQEQLHEDYRKILDLQSLATPEFDALEAEFFGDGEAKVELPRYELTSAFQGEEAIGKARDALARERPFALAFMDVRMPPGIDGIRTTEQLFSLDSELQVVISTAYADYAWEEIHKRFGSNDRLLFLRKPFDATEVHQIASTLCEKWELGRRARLRVEDLEAAVQARTSELERTIEALQSTQGRLIRSEKLASLGKLVAGLAHEINTPVGAIVSSCDSANRALGIVRSHLTIAEDDSRSQRALETLSRSQSTIETASRRMAELVDGLRRFAHLDRAESGWIDLHDSIRTILTVLTHELGDRIAVQLLQGEIPSVFCRPGEIHQLLLGLFENAIGAIDGRGTITVRTRRTGDRVEIDVEDDGRGIEPERLRSLFEVGLGTREDRVQIDWGLATLQQIVQEHGGEIHVRSRPGEGSCFTVSLSIRPEAGDAAGS